MEGEGKKWYQKSFRRHLLDMHVADWDESFLAKFDEKKYFENLKTAQVQSPMIYLQSHTGLCSWDSKSGRVHNAFRGNNKMKKLMDLCHATGMDVIAYYSLIFNNWAYDEHPEWRMVDCNGRYSRDPEQTTYESIPRYGNVCPNNEGYREFLREQIAEFCAEYDFDGIFFDMTFWPVVCFCDSCRERYRCETGKEIPKIVDWSDPDWLEFQKHREMWVKDFAEFCTAELKKYKPDVTVEHQYSTIAFGWRWAVTENVNNASEYCGGDLYGGFRQQSFICKAYYEITRNQPFEYMTSRCDPDLSDHTTTKTIEQLAVHNFLTVAHHGAFLTIDAINIDGTTDENVYRTIGEVFEMSRPYERYMDKGRLQADVAVYYSLQSKMDVLDPPASIDKAGLEIEMLNSCLGAAEAFIQNHVLYTVLTKSGIDKIMDKQAVILSNDSFLTDEEIEKFRKYVENGGCLYISGTTDPRLAEALLGLKLTGYTEETVVYVAPTEKGQEYFGKLYTPDRPVCVKRRHPICTNDNNKNEVLATLTLPFTLPADLSTFASIHSNPPAVRTQIPSVVSGTYGSGRVIWAGAAVEKNPQRAHKDVFNSLIKSLMTKPEKLKSSAPEYVDFTLFSDDDADYINCVNIDNHTPMLPCDNITVRCLARGNVLKVELLPDEAEVPFTMEGAYVCFNAKDVNPFRMYRIIY